MLCSLLCVRLRRWGSDHRSLGSALKDLFIIASYYVVGILVLHRFEGWSTVDSIYFLSVTVTTIGYGDISPTTNAGQLASCALILAGIVFVLTTLSKYASALATLVRTLTKSIMRLAGHEMVNVGDLPIEGFSPATVNSLIFYPRVYAVAVAPLVVVFFVFTEKWRHLLDLSYFEAFYFAVVTCTTVGYGDFAPRTPRDKLVCSFFLVLAVVVLSDTISQLFDIRLKKRIREGKSCQPDLEGLLLAKIRDQGADPRTVAVYESDYVVAALVESGIVDADTCRAIRRFYHWTALGADGDHHDIDLGDLHHKLVNDARREADAKSRRVARLGSLHDIAQGAAAGVAAVAADAGIAAENVFASPRDAPISEDFGEWYATVWTPKAQAAQEEAQLRKAVEAHCAAHYHVYASAAKAPGKVAPEEKVRRVDDAERPAADDSPRGMPPANHLAPLAG